VGCEVEFVEEFELWWNRLSESEQESVAAVVNLLAEYGVALKFPYSSGIAGSRHPQMRELRVQHRGRPYRILYAFDPRRSAILLLGGDKTGDDRWYDTFIPRADDLFDAHLAQMEGEE
jgi:hypothetical protein